MFFNATRCCDLFAKSANYCWSIASSLPWLEALQNLEGCSSEKFGAKWCWCSAQNQKSLESLRPNNIQWIGWSSECFGWLDFPYGKSVISFLWSEIFEIGNFSNYICIDIENGQCIKISCVVTLKIWLNILSGVVTLKISRKKSENSNAFTLF